MREIKFRGWDSANQQWWYWEHMDIHCDFWHHCRTLGHPPMQYTGLKDNKRTAEYPEGQEIYEGDIVKLPCSNGTEEQMEYCSIENKKGCFVLQKQGKTLKDITIITNALYLHYYNCEVIGNIHENPDLINNT